MHMLTKAALVLTAFSIILTIQDFLPRYAVPACSCIDPLHLYALVGWGTVFVCGMYARRRAAEGSRERTLLHVIILASLLFIVLTGFRIYPEWQSANEFQSRMRSDLEQQIQQKKQK